MASNIAFLLIKKMPSSARQGVKEHFKIGQLPSIRSVYLAGVFLLIVIARCKKGFCKLWWFDLGFKI
jgi:hypothetical protein